MVHFKDSTKQQKTKSATIKNTVSNYNINNLLQVHQGLGPREYQEVHLLPKSMQRQVQVCLRIEQAWLKSSLLKAPLCEHLTNYLKLLYERHATIPLLICNVFLHLFHCSLGPLGVLEALVNLGHPVREYHQKLEKYQASINICRNTHLHNTYI